MTIGTDSLELIVLRVGNLRRTESLGLEGVRCEGFRLDTAGLLSIIGHKLVCITWLGPSSKLHKAISHKDVNSISYILDPKPSSRNPKTCTHSFSIGAGFWGIMYYNYNKEPPKLYR